jgi:asparagine synthase (glutamine-hydrolysing)
MNGFCGWIGWGQSVEVRRQVIERMANRLEPSSSARRSTLLTNGAAVAVSARTEPPPILQQDGYLVIVQGSPRFASPEYDSLIARCGLAGAILSVYREQKEGLLGRLAGGYALVIASESGGDALIAIDRVGGRFPVDYRIVNGTVIFATHAGAIQAHSLGESAIDPQSIYNYLYFSVTPSPRSIRKEVHQLPPAGYLRVENGSARAGSHWQASYRDDDHVSVAELCEEFRGLIREAVTRDARGAKVGCFLSGGTDSSTIAGLLGPATGSPAHSYSIGFDAEGFDEMEFAREAVARFETDHHEYYLKPEDVVQTIPRVARAYSCPFGNPSAVPTYFCARMAREDGVERMLGGDGGDELFAGNKRYAVQHVLGRYERFPSFARRFAESVVFRFPEPSPFTPMRKLQSYIRQARAPMPKRLERYNYLERTGPDRIIHPDLLDVIDVNEPPDLLADVYHSANAETMLNRMLALDLRFTLADNDLPKVSRMCQMAGINVAYPFLDDEMVEFSCRVPARLKLRGLRLRWFMKHALRDFLPRKILRKRKHGFGLPFGLWMRDHRPLREFARDNLQSLKSRRFVQAGYIDDLVRMHETDHATYYGAMIWVLMMLEQWLQSNADPERA